MGDGEDGQNEIAELETRVSDTKLSKEAKEKAEGMAAAAGVKLGPLLSINESRGGGFTPQPMMSRAYSAEMGDAVTPISAGDQTLSVSVNLSYGIGE